MKKLIIAAAMTALTAGVANAAPVDGALSSTSSTGSFDVSVNIAPMVRVSGLDDIALTINPTILASNFGSTSGYTQFCVYSNVDTIGSYNVQVQGVASSDTGNPYALAGSQPGTSLNHTAYYWDGATHNSVGATFMRNSTLRPSINTQDGQARATTTDCAGGSNSSLRVMVRNPQAIAAVAGTYTGSLNVIVSVP